MTDPVVVLVQARSGSTRLPGKVLEPIGDYPVLVHVVARAEQAGYPVMVVPPGDDEPVWEACHQYGIMVPSLGYSGPEADVLGRFAHAAQMHWLDTDVFVRITADCPLLDWTQINIAVDCIDTCKVDYATNVTPRLPVDGWDVEAFTADMLWSAHLDAATAYDREHVTPWIRRHSPSRMYFNRDIDTSLQHRWTVDTPADLAWLREVHAALDNPVTPEPTASRVLELLAERDDLRRYSTMEP